MYNDFEVIDLIGYQNMIEILNEPKLETIVNRYWRGPYERESFLKHSSFYNTLINKFTSRNQFFSMT